METDFESLCQGDFEDLVEARLPFSCLIYSMGQLELYPFVLVPTVMGKLRFAHGLVPGSGG